MKRYLLNLFILICMSPLSLYSRHGMHTLDYAEQLGIGSQKYELITLQ